MTYKQTIDYLYNQLPMYSRIGDAAYKKDLHNTFDLCNALDNPQNKIKTIHIAGTNGKGSTSHMLASILQQSGYKTGLYTSPHLKDFRERIKINGLMINHQFIIDFVEKTKVISEKIKPSFFELTVAMAFDYFAHQQVDIAIIETGLGGKLDSTNIITPIVSIITNIGFDHINILGNTIQKIATEKAGIIKNNIPVIIGEYTTETKNIFSKTANEKKSTIYFAQDEYCVSNVNILPLHLNCDVTDNYKNQTDFYSLDLSGIYQTKNLCTVLCTNKILIKNGFKIDTTKAKIALLNTKKNTGINGRWDVINETPLIVLDVAHNEDGIKQVLTHLKYIQPKAKKNKLHFILGMVKDKEINKVLSLLPNDANYYFSNAHIPRALMANDLQAMAASFNLKGTCFDDVNLALNEAKKNASIDDIIIVCGSVFLVGEVNH